MVLSVEHRRNRYTTDNLKLDFGVPKMSGSATVPRRLTKTVPRGGKVLEALDSNQQPFGAAFVVGQRDDARRFARNTSWMTALKNGCPKP